MAKMKKPNLKQVLKKKLIDRLINSLERSMLIYQLCLV